MSEQNKELSTNVKPAKRCKGVVILSVLLVIALIAAGVFGYFIYFMDRQIDVLNEDIAAVEEQNIALMAEANGLQLDLTRAEKALTTAEADLSAAQADLAEANAQIEVLVASTTDLMAQVDTLTAQLAETEQALADATSGEYPAPTAADNYAVVTAILDEGGYTYKADEEASSVHTAFSIDSVLKLVSVDIDSYDTHVRVACSYPVEVPADAQGEVLRMISLINNDLNLGSFYYLPDTNQVGMSLTLYSPDRVVTADAVEEALLYALDFSEGYAESLNMVVTGQATATDAYATANP